jgi:hypothetical protein
MLPQHVSILIGYIQLETVRILLIAVYVEIHYIVCLVNLVIIDVKIIEIKSFNILKNCINCIYIPRIIV